MVGESGPPSSRSRPKPDRCPESNRRAARVAAHVEQLDGRRPCSLRTGRRRAKGERRNVRRFQFTNVWSVYSATNGLTSEAASPRTLRQSAHAARPAVQGERSNDAYASCQEYRLAFSAGHAAPRYGAAVVPMPRDLMLPGMNGSTIDTAISDDDPSELPSAAASDGPTVSDALQRFERAMLASQSATHCRAATRTRGPGTGR